MFTPKRGIVHHFEFQDQVELFTRALGYLPDDIQDFLGDRLIEVYSSRSPLTFTHNDLQAIKKHKTHAIILLPWHIWQFYNDNEVIRIILHEIARVYTDQTRSAPDETDDNQEDTLHTLTADWGFPYDPDADVKRTTETKEKRSSPKIPFFEQAIEAVDAPKVNVKERK